MLGGPGWFPGLFLTKKFMIVIKIILCVFAVIVLVVVAALLIAIGSGVGYNEQHECDEI